MRATMREVARRAGVSAMTVSRVLKGDQERVSPATTARVLQAARALDYIAVRPALQNKRLKTGVIGVVFDGAASMKSFIGAATFDGLRDAALQRGYDLLIHAERRDRLQREEAAFLDHRSDGVIFISPRQRHELLGILVRHNFPTVSCFSADVPDGVATITPDNARAMQSAVAQLFARGHSRIAYFSGPQWHSDARERRDGWIEAMRHHGLERYAAWIQSSEGETKHHVEAAQRLLSRRPTAIVCHNDWRALLVKEAAAAHGLEVPRDLSLIGMDDGPEAAAHGLTTLRVPFEDAGRLCLEALHQLMAGEAAPTASRKLEAVWIERQSVGSVRDGGAERKP